MRTTITNLILVLIAVAIPALLLNAQTASETMQFAQDVQNSEFMQVTTGEVNDFIEVLGSVEASTTSNLSFSTSGVVAEVYVEAGDYVLAGSVLAYLENETEVISYEQGVLALNRSEANEYDLQTVDDDEIALAEAALDAAWAGYAASLNSLTPEDRAAMEVEYQEELANAARLAQEASTANGGYGSAAYNQLSAEAGEASFMAELTRLQNEQAIANNQVNANSAYGRVLAAQADLDAVLAGASPAQLEQAALNVTSSQDQLTSLQADYIDTFLVAPFDGYVSAVNTEVGESVTQNAGVVTLTDVTPLELVISIDETDLSDVTLEMPVEVRFDALPDVVIDGTLQQISELGTVVNGIVTYDAQVLIDTFPQGVRIGMSADVRLITDAIENVVAIPNRFLREDPDTGRISVTAFSDGEFVERDVTLGLRGVQSSEVLEGLQASDVVTLQLTTEESSGGFTLQPPGN